jgi:3-hydroxybutyryl-CoA dehydrogenase
MLVEIICGIRTSPQTEQAAIEFARALGKTPISIKDVPGFAVNRLLHVFMIEAVMLVEEGVENRHPVTLKH